MLLIFNKPYLKANEGIILRNHAKPRPILLESSLIHLRTMTIIGAIPPLAKLKKYIALAHFHNLEKISQNVSYYNVGNTKKKSK
jgi:hypothetical protein